MELLLGIGIIFFSILVLIYFIKDTPNKSKSSFEDRKKAYKKEYEERKTLKEKEILKKSSSKTSLDNVKKSKETDNSLIELKNELILINSLKSILPSDRKQRLQNTVDKYSDKINEEHLDPIYSEYNLINHKKLLGIVKKFVLKAYISFSEVNDYNSLLIKFYLFGVLNSFCKKENLDKATTTSIFNSYILEELKDKDESSETLDFILENVDIMPYKDLVSLGEEEFFSDEESKLYELIKKINDEEKNTSISLNPIDWYKFTKIILNSEKKFQDIYNFDVPSEYKTRDIVVLLVFTVLFEEMRINKLLPEKLPMVFNSIRKQSPIYEFILPDGFNQVIIGNYKRIYSNYINNRAKRFRPIVATTLSSTAEFEFLNDNDAKQFAIEYENNPFFGDSI